jgi:hypothetical protein
MAVTATATPVFGGTNALTITGDAAGDHIAVVGTANPGEFTVTGRNGTTVNGTPDGSVTISGVTGDLIVDLGDGENILDVDNTYIAGQIEITTGAGNDRLSLGANRPVSPAGQLLVNTGAGSDTLLENNVYIGTSQIIDTAEGADVVRWTTTSARNFLGGQLGDGDNSFFGSGITAQGIGMRAGAGGNSMAVLLSYASGGLSLESLGGVARFYVDTVYAEGEIHLGTGFNNSSPATFNVFRCISSEIDLAGGAGDDQFNVYGNQLTRMDVHGQSGHDGLDLSYTICSQDIFVVMAGGDDTVIATGNFTQSPYQAVFEGNEGFNRLTLRGNQFPLLWTNNFVMV